MTATPEKCFIAVGSNIEPSRHLPLAVDRLRALGRLVGASRVYENPAVGPSGQPDYLNTAALILTDRSVTDVWRFLRQVEAGLDRVRTADRFAPRTIDLDLCYHGSSVLTTSDLTLPHPDAAQQAYVAIPLAELDPTFVHPVTGESLQTLANRLRSSSKLVERSDISRLCAEIALNPR